MDGVADDGPPGQNDNVRPGTAEVVVRSGDHVLIADDTPNTLSASGTGRSELEGGGGDDRISGHQMPGDVVRGGDGDDIVRADAADTIAADCETVTIG